MVYKTERGKSRMAILFKGVVSMMANGGRVTVNDIEDHSDCTAN